ncbi:hypothetical protein HK107_11740 [Parvularcula sp. ZS-1/3]|uniref:Uncharacterized protein n=1 Tax=Parvularcula mediterranea TaxID=2732508 RepID=A0A7Y3RPG8_9PROT|nr:hypothetical protein [Parvularcula mediterranea]NNU16992.1 hypothetical protein [Parvularcula mediterranea]
MATKSQFQVSSEGFGVAVEGVVDVADLSLVIHSECLLDIASVDLDDPSTFLGERDLLPIVPVDAV